MLDRSRYDSAPDRGRRAALFAAAGRSHACRVIVGYDRRRATFGMVLAAGSGEWSFRWLSRPFTAAFHFGATPISFWLALLLAVCTACAIAATRVARTRDFVALMLMLEGTMLGLFLARDLLVFALFWDLMLLPVFFALIGWGEHPATAWRYFIYNFAGGLTLLLATAAFGVIYGSTDVIGRAGAHLAGGWAAWIYRRLRLRVLGEDAGLAAAHLDAADV